MADDAAPSWVPSKRDYVSEIQVISSKSKFQPVRQHPLNMEIKKADAVGKAPVVPIHRDVSTPSDKLFISGSPLEFLLISRLLFPRKPP